MRTAKKTTTTETKPIAEVVAIDPEVYVLTTIKRLQTKRGHAVTKTAILQQLEREKAKEVYARLDDYLSNLLSAGRCRVTNGLFWIGLVAILLAAGCSSETFTSAEPEGVAGSAGSAGMDSVVVTAGSAGLPAAVAGATSTAAGSPSTGGATSTAAGSPSTGGATSMAAGSPSTGGATSTFDPTGMSTSSQLAPYDFGPCQICVNSFGRTVKICDPVQCAKTVCQPCTNADGTSACGNCSNNGGVACNAFTYCF